MPWACEPQCWEHTGRNSTGMTPAIEPGKLDADHAAASVPARHVKSEGRPPRVRERPVGVGLCVCCAAFFPAQPSSAR